MNLCSKLKYLFQKKSEFDCRLLFDFLEIWKFLSWFREKLLTLNRMTLKEPKETFPGYTFLIEWNIQCVCACVGYVHMKLTNNLSNERRHISTYSKSGCQQMCIFSRRLMHTNGSIANLVTITMCINERERMREWASDGERKKERAVWSYTCKNILVDSNMKSKK